MIRVGLKGAARVKKILADGTARVYVYAWRGGPLLRYPDGTPIPLDDHKALMSAYTEEHKKYAAGPQGSMATLIRDFKASSEFTGKSDKTQRAYKLYLTKIEEEFGGMTLRALQDPSARGDFKEWRDTMADRPRTADYAWTTLARVLSVAKDRGKISVNVCERGGRLYKADRAEAIWTADDIKAFTAAASPELSLALIAALWTGQREGDLLRAPWSAYDGKHVRIRQGKTGARVRIPVGETLRKFLDAAPQRSTTILVNTRGRSWTEDGFRTSWGKACAKANITGLTFHDLRGTAVTRLALAGCSTSQIASITGHSLKDVESILDAHYLGGRFELAESAIERLEKHEKRTKHAN